MKLLYRLLCSLRTTLALLSILALLLLLNVALPQVSVIGQRALDEIASRSSLNHFLLVVLGFGHVTTSPIFLTTLGLFFLQLAVVLIRRAGPTWRRIGVRPRSAEGLRAWAGTGESLTAPLPEGWDVGIAARTLRGFGYHVKRLDAGTVWGVKHRTAPLGFLLFHVSFFLMLAGGVLLYYTRFEATATLAEGQTFSETYDRVNRQAPYGVPPPLTFTVETVQAHSAEGEPTHLSAVLQFSQGGSVVQRTTRVNHPARWGAANILVNRAGLAPVLWLQDHRGATLDRVVIAATTRGGEPTSVTLGGGRYLVTVLPLRPDAPFPTRDELRSWPVGLAVKLRNPGEKNPGDTEVEFLGRLRPGESILLTDDRLVVEEIRLWAGVLIVSERGGGLLIAGFLAGVVGLVWRLLLHRREVAVVWSDDELRLVGRSESYPWRFREELGIIFSTLRKARGASSVWHSTRAAAAGS